MKDIAQLHTLPEWRKIVAAQLVVDGMKEWEATGRSCNLGRKDSEALNGMVLSGQFKDKFKPFIKKLWP